MIWSYWKEVQKENTYPNSRSWLVLNLLVLIIGNELPTQVLLKSYFQVNRKTNME